MRDLFVNMDVPQPPPQRCLFGRPKTMMTAKRSLFGRITDEQRVANKALIAKVSRMFEDRDNQRYNFDFAKGEPLQGENQWEVVANPPEVYLRMCSETERACSTPPSRRRLLGSVDENRRAEPRLPVTIPSKSRPSAFSVTVPSSQCTTTGASSRCAAENRPVAAEQPTSTATSSSSSSSVQRELEASPSSSTSSGRGQKRKQPKITDIFPAAKKSSRRKLDFGGDA